MGIPELVVVLAIAAPLLAAGWGLRAAYRVKAEQQATRDRLDAIERAMRAQPPGRSA